MKFHFSTPPRYPIRSPSMRREWIEIIDNKTFGMIERSPSMRREWIEIAIYHTVRHRCRSPSMRREWIEMPFFLRIE